MTRDDFPGELEEKVLLAVLQLGDRAYALDVLRALDIRAGKRLSRGALYKTLARLETKGLVEWDQEEATPGRGGHPRRRFSVTPEGIRILRASRAALLRLWEGLEPLLGGP